jgi:hypothetical protein
VVVLGLGEATAPAIADACAGPSSRVPVPPVPQAATKRAMAASAAPAAITA